MRVPTTTATGPVASARTSCIRGLKNRPRSHKNWTRCRGLVNSYGNLTTHTGTTDTPLRYTGQYQGPTTNLYYLRARWYDPASALFLTRDPLEATTGQPYQYANDNPLDGTDPSGLSTKGYCIGGGAAWGIGIIGEVCIVTSSSGQIGVTGTLGGGGGSPNASVGGYEQWSNANDINQLRGPFGYAGVGVGEGVSVGGGGFIGQDSCGNVIYGGELGGGVGARLPLPFEVHGGASYTGVHVFGGAPATVLKIGFTAVQTGVNVVTQPIHAAKDAWDTVSSWF